MRHGEYLRRRHYPQVYPTPKSQRSQRYQSHALEP
jgi:hypothetical protein